jgi:RHS repeat-associated protein
VQADSTILITGTTCTCKYYSFAGQMVAMAECGPHGYGSGLNYFLTDHLGSVVAVVNPGGGLVSQQRYMPFGEVRTDVGTITQTDFGYTGQRNLDAQGNSFSTGLMDYKARFYDPYLNRFISPDTLTPGGPQGLNRYSYSNNNPINYNDPTGHCVGAGGHEFADGSSACNSVASEGYGDPCAEAGYTGVNYGICQRDQSASTIDTSILWDLVPYVGAIRAINYDAQVVSWASSQPDFIHQMNEQKAWIDKCYGGCHYPDYIDHFPGTPINGPRPDIPLFDTWNAAGGDMVAEGFNLAAQVATTVDIATELVPPFAHGGESWHVGLETRDQMSIIHLGNDPARGVHLAFGAVAPMKADLHVYLFPDVYIWRPSWGANGAINLWSWK